jgi:23S rRNA A2030 N6-methylase RlmJ
MWQTAPIRFIMEWIESRYQHTICATFGCISVRHKDALERAGVMVVATPLTNEVLMRNLLPLLTSSASIELSKSDAEPSTNELAAFFAP